jgi:beta-N-acetylglucosaminidase
MEYIQDDMSQKLGEMKRAMDLSLDFINGVDVQNGLLSDKGQAMLEAYNHGEFKLIQLDTPSANTTRNIETPKDSSYKGLLD